ncbi:MAG: RecX family transcriptional regulator [Sphingobacteriales bacterium]|nr:RecX family transcriptional regulator [Sphingobacteriales bacterium]
MQKKLRTIKETDPYKKRQKLVLFALQKGYESEIVNEVLKVVLAD